MSGPTQTGVQLESVDFAIAAVRDAEGWRVVELPDAALAEIDVLIEALDDLGDDVLGLIAVDEDFFLAVRTGEEVQVLLSDVTAAGEWNLADSALDYLDISDDTDDEARQPAGDLGLVDDHGVSASMLAMLIDNPELYPDEVCSEIALRLGFGADFDQVAGLASA